MPVDTLLKLDPHPQPWFRFSLRSLLLLVVLVAILSFVSGRESLVRTLQTVSVTLLGATVIFAVPTLVSRFALGFIVSLLMVAALNVYTLERSYRAYVYDGTPCVGWPYSFASGNTGWFPPVGLPDFHFYQEPYWLTTGNLRFDLWMGLGITALGATSFSRPRKLSLEARLPNRYRVVGWIIRCVILWGLAYVLLQNEMFYRDQTHYVRDGTPLDQLLLGIIAALLALLFAFPAHVWEHRRRPQPLDSRRRSSPFLTAVVKATVAASTLLLFLLKAAHYTGSWQNYYLNQPLTIMLIAISIALLFAYACIQRKSLT